MEVMLLRNCTTAKEIPGIKKKITNNIIIPEILKADAKSSSQNISRI